jgi:hypothetical protein
MLHSSNVPIFKPYLPHTSQGVVVGTTLTPTLQEWKVSYNNYKVMSLVQTFKCYLGAYTLSSNVVKKHI